MKERGGRGGVLTHERRGEGVGVLNWGEKFYHSRKIATFAKEGECGQLT